MIETYLLEHIDAFARTGTLSAAAESLHVSQPALTRSMKKLEHDMGIPLFCRDRRRLALNPAGKIVADYASRILQLHRDMMERARMEDRLEHTAVLGSSSLSPVGILFPVLNRWLNDWSIITEKGNDAELIDRLHQRLCQLALLHQIPDDGRLFCRKYLDEQICISLPPEHPLSARKCLHKDDLKGLSILTYDLGVCTDICRENLPDTTFLIQTDPDTMDELVHATDFPLFNTDLLLYDGYIPSDRHSVPLDEDFAHITYYLACLDAEKDRYAGIFRDIEPQQTDA